MSIYSNDNIIKIAKLTTRELPQKSKNAKITVRENNGLYSTSPMQTYQFFFFILIDISTFKGSGSHLQSQNVRLDKNNGM